METPQQQGRQRRPSENGDLVQQQTRKRFRRQEDTPLLRRLHDNDEEEEEETERVLPVDDEGDDTASDDRRGAGASTSGSGGGGEEGGSGDDGWDEWRPLLLASPSDTSFHSYGPDDVAIVEPPHRGDDDRKICFGGGVSASRGLGVDPPAGKGRVSAEGEGAPPLLHELVVLALRLGGDVMFRAELDGMLRRYLDRDAE